MGLTRVVALDISKAFNSVGYAGLLQTQVGCLVLFRFFRSNRRLRVTLDGKFSQEYPFNVGNYQGSLLDLILFVLYINDILDDFICNAAIYEDFNTLYSKCEQASE